MVIAASGLGSVNINLLSALKASSNALLLVKVKKKQLNKNVRFCSIFIILGKIVDIFDHYTLSLLYSLIYCHDSDTGRVVQHIFLSLIYVSR